jgi:hypothetical protein
MQFSRAVTPRLRFHPVLLLALALLIPGARASRAATLSVAGIVADFDTVRILAP